MVYATGDADESTLTIKQVASGTETTIFTDTQDLDALTALDERAGLTWGRMNACIIIRNSIFLRRSSG